MKILCKTVALSLIFFIKAFSMQQTNEANFNEAKIVIYLLEQEKINYNTMTEEPAGKYIGDYSFQIPTNKKTLEIEGEIIQPEDNEESIILNASFTGDLFIIIEKEDLAKLPLNSDFNQEEKEYSYKKNSSSFIPFFLKIILASSLIKPVSSFYVNHGMLYHGTGQNGGMNTKIGTHHTPISTPPHMRNDPYMRLIPGPGIDRGAIGMGHNPFVYNNPFNPALNDFRIF